MFSYAALCDMLYFPPMNPKGFDEREGRIKDRSKRQREAKLAVIGGGGVETPSRKVNRSGSSGSGDKKSVSGNGKVRAK